MRVASPGRMLGIDSSHAISAELADWLANGCDIKIGFVMRYLRRRRRVDDEPRSKWPVFLSRSELDGLHKADLMVGLTQTFVGRDMLSEYHGERAGDAAAWNARTIGAPPKVTVYCDAEWGAARSRQADRRGYLRGWPRGAHAVQRARSRGMYVGSNIGLTGAELYAMQGYHRYWKSLSVVPWVYPRGYCLLQSWEHVLLGRGPDEWRLVPRAGDDDHRGPIFDLNMSALDNRGGSLTCMAA